MRNGPTVTHLDGIVPAWVPRPAVHYLAHIEAGLPIRELARGAGCHASTVLRQIRSFETRREDPLVDAALCRLGRIVPPMGDGSPIKERRMPPSYVNETDCKDETALTEVQLSKEGTRVLRRLCESGALLVVAPNMDKAVIVRDRAGAEPTRTGIVDKEVAEAMALKGWIQCGEAGRITRYTISNAGREALSRLLAEAENSALGFADAQAPFLGHGAAASRVGDAETKPARKRYASAESPLLVLSRRKDKDGDPFLPDHLVRAGERLREDFELAEMDTRNEQNWDAYLTEKADTARGAPNAASAPMPSRQARDRVANALRDLGPGLGDVVLRCCCHLEGLETAEKRMGWSARSGKVVLRIALQRLSRHYRELGDAGQMIG